MLELLAPAGSTEAVIAAVQSGADTIYIGEHLTALGRGERDFDRESMAQSIRYCRIRGCKVVVAIQGLYTDERFSRALKRARFASREGADALLVRDAGLIVALRRVLPDMPLWGDVRLGVRNAEGVAAAAALGLSRVFLAPELSGDQIASIAKSAPIETAVYVHGPVCVAHSGQCYMSAMAHEHVSDSCMRCPQPCRGRFSLGGRMDECPLSMADVCLIDHLAELEEAGVTCAVIEGRSRRPEYVGYVTRLYARAIQEKVLPTQEERDALKSAFSTHGLTDGYYTGEPGPEMFGQPEEPDRSTSRIYSDVRKGYMNGELRRVPVKFYAVLQADKPALFAAEDGRGNRAVYQGFEPLDMGRQGISQARVRELLYRTGGTPFNCTEVNCAVGPNLDYPDEAIEEARRQLLGQLTDKNREPVQRPEGECPPRPEGRVELTVPKLIIQVTHAEQLTEDLAAAKPDYLYVPAELLASGEAKIAPFMEQGTQIVAALPLVVSEAEGPVLRELLQTLKDRGIDQVLAGNWGLLPAVRQAGMTLRGDFSLNVANSWSLGGLGRAGFSSVTVSCELTAKQIAALSKPCDTEMIVYGRVPVMVTDHCLIRNSAGRCACSTPTSMGDTFGSVYPVEKEFGCRNTIFDARKIFLADHPETYTDVGLWGLRLLFTTESPRECVSVTKRYKGENEYVPINASRGAYRKGALWN